MRRGMYIGDAGPVWNREHVQVFAEMRGDFRDELNDPEREVQTVEHETVRYGDVPFISITWEYGTKRELRNGNGGGGAGIDPEVIAALPATARKRAERILELADRWHLNTMRAGCAHQGIVYETDRYGREVPSLSLTPPCPLTGYEYGHAWLVEVPPAEVLAELRELFGFTDAVVVIA